MLVSILYAIVSGLCVVPLASASPTPGQSQFYGASNITIGGTNISTGNPSSCQHPTLYFRQLVEHESNATQNNTFLQQYQVISDYWKPGGSILFYQGAENSQILCLESLALPSFAEELGALLVSIEHRYFGASIPYGLKVTDSPHWTLQQWSALTLANVLADSVTLLDWLKETTPGLEDSKVISFGGSYGAMLASTLRTHYPEHFYGAIPTCGIYNGFDTNPNSTTVYAFVDWVSNAIADMSATAASIIREGFTTVRSLMEKGDFDTLATSINLCTPPTSSNQTVQLLAFILSDYIQNTQFGFSTPAYCLGSPRHACVPPHQLQYLVNETLAAPTPLAAINASISLGNARSFESCLPWQGDDGDAYGSMQLSYIVCTYLPYPFAKNYARAESIFGQVGEVDHSTLNVNDAFCQELFGIDAKKGDLNYQRELGISQEQASSQERFFFVQGQYDPVSGLGLNSWVASSDRNQARWWQMAEAAHTEDIFAPSPFDTQPLVDTRAAQLSYMKSWLGMES